VLSTVAVSDDGSAGSGAEFSLAFECVIRKRGVLRTQFSHEIYFFETFNFYDCVVLLLEMRHNTTKKFKTKALRIWKISI